MKKQVKKIVYAEHDDKNVRYVRRIETKLVEDGNFEYLGKPIRTESDLERILHRLRDSDREQAVILFLDHENKPIGYDLWLGGVDFVAIDPRRILMLAGTVMASKVVVAHNHPYGNAQPSNADTMFAMQMGQLAKIMGWEFYDFMILSSSGCYSFRTHSHPSLGTASSPFRIIQESGRADLYTSVVLEINEELKKAKIDASVSMVHDSLEIKCSREYESRVREIADKVIQRHK